jgi:hypothetical protein
MGWNSPLFCAATAPGIKSERTGKTFPEIGIWSNGGARTLAAKIEACKGEKQWIFLMC